MEWVTGETITAEKLNNMGALICTQDAAGYIDKTGNEVKEAVEAGRLVLFKYENEYGTVWDIGTHTNESLNDQGQWTGFNCGGNQLSYFLWDNESMDDYMHIYFD